MKISGRVVDVHRREIYPAEINLIDGRITEIIRVNEASHQFILPGLIDSHIHIESSMLSPGNFASAALKQGTIGVVSDPHEIANVMGLKGIEFMVRDSEKVPFYFWFGVPSCVPATDLEISGDRLDRAEVETLLKSEKFKYLSEMMNFPGVINGDPEVKAKLDAAKRNGKPVDGHAPGLSGESLRKYIEAGISTDHECSSLSEAEEKIRAGIKILIREGSAAKNLEALKPLYKSFPGKIMLCSDDLHPEMLETGHINKLIQRLNKEYDYFDILRSCTINPKEHYCLENGVLQPGDNADFVLSDSPDYSGITEVWIKGNRVFETKGIQFSYKADEPINKFNSGKLAEPAIQVKRRMGKMKVIKAFDGELLTEEVLVSPPSGEYVVSDVSEDILKIVVKDRYRNSLPAVGFINGFGLKNGAIASSVSHDSHNIICVGTNDSDIITCINEVTEMKGGLAAVAGKEIFSLPLPIAGIMSDRSCSETAAAYTQLNKVASELGSHLSAPFMTLSFMALLVIPRLKIGDKGLFDVEKFSFTDLFTS